MNRIIKFIGATVLLGILIHLGYVFVFFFDRLDNGSVIGWITGATFALASVYFVVKVPQAWLKITMIVLDVCTILYYYLHSRLSVPIEYSSVIVAAYTGLIVYFVGRIVSADLAAVETSETERLRNEVNRYRIGNELANLETERDRYARRVKESKTDSTRIANEARLEEIENKIYELKKQIK